MAFNLWNKEKNCVVLVGIWKERNRKEKKNGALLNDVDMVLVKGKERKFRLVFASLW